MTNLNNEINLQNDDLLENNLAWFNARLKLRHMFISRRLSSYVSHIIKIFDDEKTDIKTKTIIARILAYCKEMTDKGILKIMLEPEPRIAYPKIYPRDIAI